MKNTNQENDFIHKLWLIYSQLKDAENDPVQRIELLERSREELGAVLNEMYGCFYHLKKPCKTQIECVGFSLSG